MIELTERVGAEPKVVHEADNKPKKGDKKPKSAEDKAPAKE